MPGQRSQSKNRELAMKMLRSRLYDLEIQKRQAHTDKLDESKLDISFGSQIRSYVMQPYRLIKDHRTKFEVGDVDRVMDGDLDPFIRSYLMAKKTKGSSMSSRTRMRTWPSRRPMDATVSRWEPDFDRLTHGQATWNQCVDSSPREW